MNRVNLLSFAGLVFLFGCPGFLSARERNIEGIEEIVVSATLSPLTAKHLSSSVTILTKEDIAASGLPFLADILRRVPGVALTQSGGAGALANLRIRGGESDHTKVLINGVEVNDASSAQFDFGSLMSSQIERVEIIRGSQSLIHGANATGGVIAITTKTGRGDPIVDYQADGGSFGTWHGALNFGGGGEGFSFGGGLDVYHSDGHDISTLGRDEKDEYRNYTAHARADWSKDVLNMRFTLRHVNSRSDGDSFSAATHPDGPSLDRTKQTEAGLGASRDWLLGKKLNWHHEVNLSLLDVDRRIKGDFPSSLGQQRVNAHYKTSLNYSDQADLAVLLGWEEEELNTSTDFTEVEQFIATEAQLSLGGFDLTAGVRGEFYNNSEDGALWRLTAARDLPIGSVMPVRVHGSYGTSINKPTLYDLYGFSPTTYCPNPDLKPEEAVSWDIGLDFDFTSFVSGLSFGATAFGIDVEDEFESVFGTPPRLGCPAGTTSSIINVSRRSKRVGAELQADWQVSTNLLVSAHYTYTRAQQADGAESIRRPKNVWSVNVVWRRGSFSLGGDMIWTDRQQDIDAETFASITTGSHFLLNLHGSYALDERLDVFVRLENITDEGTIINGYDRRGFGVYAGIKGRF